MRGFITSIRSAVSAENWFAALFLALAAPDICGALENPNTGVGDRYKNWFVRYLKRKYNPANSYEVLSENSPEMLARMMPFEIESLKSSPAIAACAFTAEDCYRFRCKCLHQGLAQKVGGEKIHFIAPHKGNSRIVVHKNVFNGVYQLQIDIFCLDVCAAVERWLVDVLGNADVQARMNDLIEIYDLASTRHSIFGFQ